MVVTNFLVVISLTGVGQHPVNVIVVVINIIVIHIIIFCRGFKNALGLKR
jgi:hypothetical protein